MTIAQEKVTSTRPVHPGKKCELVRYHHITSHKFVWANVVKAIPPWETFK